MEYCLVPKKKLMDLIMDSHELRIFEKCGARDFLNRDISSSIKYDEIEDEYIRKTLKKNGVKIKDRPKGYYNLYDIAENEIEKYQFLTINMDDMSIKIDI